MAKRQQSVPAYAFKDPRGAVLKVRLNLSELIMEVAGEFADTDEISDFEDLGWDRRVTSRLLNEGYELLLGTFKVTKKVSLGEGGR